MIQKAFYIEYEDLELTLLQCGIDKDKYEKYKNEKPLYLQKNQITTYCTKKEIMSIFENLKNKYNEIIIYSISKKDLYRYNFIPKEILLRKGE